MSDKEILFLIQQKLKEIKNKNEDKNKSQNKSKVIENKTINNSFKALGEEELKELLNPLYFKDLNNTNNTITNILNNTNNTNLFSSIYQDSSLQNQTKTFIDIPKNYSLKTENNLNINNNSRPKSSLFQYLGNDILLKGDKPINLINYIAKKIS